MKSIALVTLSAALFGFANAAPVDKRDYDNDVYTAVVTKTVVVTSTVWVDPIDVATTLENNGAQFYESATPTPVTTSTTPPPPPPSSSSPPPPPPAPSSQAPPVAAPEPTQAPPAPVVKPEPAPQAPAPYSQAPAPAPAPAPESPSTGGGSGEYAGKMTYYTPGMGACGVTNSESDWIVAISHEMFDTKAQGANPNANGFCKQPITIYYDGKSYKAQITDRCEGCAYNDIDMPKSMFSTISNGNVDAGRLPVTWSMG